MRFGLMAAAAACVVAMPASAATIVNDTDVTGKTIALRGCCVSGPTLTNFDIINAAPGATVHLGGFNPLNVLGQIDLAGSFQFDGARFLLGDNYGRFYGVLRVYDGARLTTFTLDRFVVTGGPTSPAPEPATWALMILGFGAIGAAMRKRRHHAAMVM